MSDNKFKGDFQKEVVDLSKTESVVVDFYADWCSPCRQLSTKLDQAVLESKGKIKLVKINIDQYDSLAAEFNVNSIPYVMLYQNGVKVKEFKGYDLDALKELINLCNSNISQS